MPQFSMCLFLEADSPTHPEHLKTTLPPHGNYGQRSDKSSGHFYMFYCYICGWKFPNEKLNEPSRFTATSLDRLTSSVSLWISRSEHFGPGPSGMKRWARHISRSFTSNHYFEWALDQTWPNRIRLSGNVPKLFSIFNCVINIWQS